MSRNRIGIVFLNYWLGVSVSVIETAKTLAAERFAVDIFVNASSFSGAPIEFNDPNIHLFVIGLEDQQSGSSIPDLKSFIKSLITEKYWNQIKQAVAPLQYWLINSFKPIYGIKDFIHVIRAHWSSYLDTLISQLSRGDYVALIGVEPLGLIVACYAIESLAMHKTHLIYFNLELLEYTKSMDLKQRLTKDYEIICSRKCDFTIIPDEGRGKVFSRVNGIDDSRLRYLPISMAGDPISTKGRYFRDLFNITDDKKVVLYAGNIREWAMCREIVESVDSWRDEFVLVMHTWKRDLSRDQYYQEIVKIANPERIYFSTKPLPYERLPEVLSSADVGLAFYKPIDANFIETGSSSNKLAQYVQVGLPVITNDLPSIRRVFDRYGSGICVEHPAQIGEALESIFGDYDRFRRGAFDSHREHYNFYQSFKPILSELKEMSIAN